MILFRVESTYLPNKLSPLNFFMKLASAGQTQFRSIAKIGKVLILNFISLLFKSVSYSNFSKDDVRHLERNFPELKFKFM